MANLESSLERVWSPIPGTSQELALDTRCHHTLYTGARGPGKTDTQLMRFRRRVGIGYGPFWRGIIFDREYKNLDDIVTKSKRWFNAFEDGCKFLESTSSYKWVWPTGEELLFRVVKDDDDYWSYHGHEYPFIGWNELTKFPTGVLYRKLMSCNRSSFTPEKDTPRRKFPHKPKNLDARKNEDGTWEVYDTPNGELLPPIPLEVFATCNPYGAGHNWVKRLFIDPAPYGTVVRKEFDVIDPRTKEEIKVTKTQVAIFGSYVENIYLTPEYVASLHDQDDESQRKAWLEGDWDIVAGGALDDVWRRNTHVLPRFVIPSTWTIDRAFDWGSTKPFSIGWFAEANGEEAFIIHNEKKYRFCPPPGTLIQFYEWYGCRKDKDGNLDIGSNVGIKMSSGDIAEEIKKIEEALKAQGWISGDVYAGPADNSIRDVRESDVDSIEKKMQDKGVNWSESDKSPGSRKIGLELARERFRASSKREGAGLYFTTNCVASCAILPTLPRDPDKTDDVDTTSEDHVWDMLRYRVLKGNNRIAGSVPVGMPS